MNQSYIWVIAVAVVVLIVLLYMAFYRPLAPQVDLESALQKVQEASLVKVNVVTNPTENLPEINPVTKANPFSNTYQNPFQ